MKSKTIQNLLLASLLLLMSAGGAISLVWLISKNSGLLTEQLVALKEQNQQEASLLRLQRLANETEADREKLSNYFLLRESDSITFLSEIESLAPKLGLQLETEELKQLLGEDKVSWIEAGFSVTGSRKNIERFVQLLEALPYVSKVTSVQMNSQSGRDWSAEIRIQVQLLNI
jgi:flagellar basal body-associated protein FliL